MNRHSNMNKTEIGQELSALEKSFKALEGLIIGMLCLFVVLATIAHMKIDTVVHLTESLRKVTEHRSSLQLIRSKDRKDLDGQPMKHDQMLFEQTKRMVDEALRAKIPSKTEASENHIDHSETQTKSPAEASPPEELPLMK